MSRPLLALMVVALMVGLQPAESSLSHGVLAASLPAPSGQRLLYQANWSHGKLGWTSDGNGRWSTSGGVLAYSGQAASVILTRFRVKPTQNIAVEARIQALAQDGSYNGNSGFGILVRAKGPMNLYPDDSAKSGFAAGAQHRENYTYGGANGTFASIWTPPSVYPQPIDSSDFEWGTSWHTYRVEIRRTRITLFVDEQVAAEGNSTGLLTGTRLGLFRMNYEVLVRSFKVFALTR